MMEQYQPLYKMHNPKMMQLIKCDFCAHYTFPHTSSHTCTHIYTLIVTSHGHASGTINKRSQYSICTLYIGKMYNEYISHTSVLQLKVPRRSIQCQYIKAASIKTLHGIG